MEKCPINQQPCGGDQCVLWLKLDDFEGCPLDLADKAIQDFKTNTILPAAIKLDGLVKRALKQKE